MLFHDRLVYLLLQHWILPSSYSSQVAPGEVVTLEPADRYGGGCPDADGRNPYLDIVFSPALIPYLVSSVGDLRT